MRLLAALAFAAFALPAFAQAPAAAADPAAAPLPGPPPRVSLLTTEGEIIVELDQAKAPKSVDNFLRYVKDGHYNGTIFHRVIPGFMIQGGGYNASLGQKPAREPIVNEAKNGLQNARGTLAMARTQDPDSASAQFFINLANNGFLNPSPGNAGYAVFGKVVQGMDVVDKIAAKPTQNKSPEFANLPVEYIVIQKAEQLPNPVVAPAQ